MARSIEIIQAEIMAQISADPNLTVLTANVSSVAVFRLFSYCIAVAINTFEQLQDIWKAEVQAVADATPTATPLWWQAQLFKFQYDDTVPQVLELNGFVPQYVTVDSTKRIITNASVRQDANTRKVRLKVAKGTLGAREPLATAEQDALKAYVNQIQPAGVVLEVISIPADVCKVVADVYFDAQYIESLVKANVVSAINAYLQNIDFDSVVLKSKIEDAIQAVDGVKAVDLQGFFARQSSGAYTTTIPVRYEAVAGYIVADDSAGNTLDDTITMKIY